MDASGAFEIIYKHEEGQSIFEFLVTLPALIIFALTLVKVNSAIQVSIVNQQYSRAQALFLAFNNSIYPELSHQLGMANKGWNQMLIGVSDNLAPAAAEDYNPQATVQLISRANQPAGSDDAHQDAPLLRGRVRIRNSVTLCTQNLTLKSAKGTLTPILSLQASQGSFVASGLNQLQQGSNLGNYCGSPTAYE